MPAPMNGPATISASTRKKMSEANDAFPLKTIESRHKNASASSAMPTPISALPSVAPPLRRADDDRVLMCVVLPSFKPAATAAAAARPAAKRAAAEAATAPPAAPTTPEHLGGGLDQIREAVAAALDDVAAYHGWLRLAARSGDGARSALPATPRTSVCAAHRAAPG